MAWAVCIQILFLTVVIPAMLQTSLPQPLMTAIGPTNQVLITILALRWGFISHPAPIWCAKFSSYRKLLALKVCKFIPFYKHTWTHVRAHAHTHTHIHIYNWNILQWIWDILLDISSFYYHSITHCLQLFKDSNTAITQITHIIINYTTQK